MESQSFTNKLLQIGQWLEVQRLDLSLCASVRNLGWIQYFLLAPEVTEHLGETPYFRFQKLSSGRWKSKRNEGPGYGGNIFRIQDHEISSAENSSLLELLRDPQSRALEITLTDFKISSAALDKLSQVEECPPLLLKLSQEASSSLLQKVRNLISRKESWKRLRCYPPPYDLERADFTSWIHLENFQPPIFQQNARPVEFSIVIPHYENPHFLCNSLYHLSKTKNSHSFEVLVIDDGSQRKSLEYLQYFVRNFCPALGFSLFFWGEGPKLQDGSKIFRAGASRNWGAYYSRSENLIFLDSDMLVPGDFHTILDDVFKKADVTQFKRLHIPVTLSHESALYDSLSPKSLYIEEASYWSDLFEAEDWMALKDHWKYTCTYALALPKSLFNQAGRLRRNFIRYGFEDTDLGYRLANRRVRFRLEKVPLLHLTAKAENTDSAYYKYKKMQRIRPMARVFFELNQDPDIYRSLGSLIR